jgi:peroxiredoxin
LEVAPLKGSIAPDFSLQDLSGNSVHLSDFHGEVVLINFWATWCPPCWQEMPTFQEYYTQYDTDFVVLAVDGDEPENAVRDFVAENGLTFPVVIDVGQKVTETYLVRSYPTSFIVDQDGVISKIHIGIMTHEQLDGYLAPLGIGQ